MRRTALVVLVAFALGACTTTVEPTPLQTVTPTASPRTDLASTTLPTQSPSPSAIATTSPSFAPLPTPSSGEPIASPETLISDGIAWTRFDGSSLPGLGGDTYVQQTGGRFLVSSEKSRSEFLLSSEDGLTWLNLGAVVSQPDSAREFHEVQNSIVALGSHGPNGPYNPPQIGVWLSADGGHTWSFLDEPSFTSHRCGAGPSVMTSDGAELVAIGSGIWHSADGFNWVCVGPTPHDSITYGHGTFVGVWSTDPYSEPQRFWHSDDGVTWQQVQKAPLSTELPIAIGAGFVTIAGADGPGRPSTRLLTSADGMTWSEQPYPFGDADLYLVGSDGDRAVALQEERSADPNEAKPGAIWVSSSNGTAWSKYQVPPRAGDVADGVALLGDVIVVTGFSGGNSTVDAVVWSAQLP